MSQEAIEFIIKRFDVDLRPERPIKSISHLTQFPGCNPILSLRQRLKGSERTEAIAVQIGRLVLGHVGQSWVWSEVWRERREWAAKYLIPDSALEQTKREELSVWELAEMCDVTPTLVEARMTKVPFFGRVGCGRRLELSEHPEGTREVPQYLADGADGVVEACDDSMEKAGIVEGSVLIVKRQSQAKDGQIVLANVPGEGTTCKRYRRRFKYQALLSENSTKYPEIPLGDDMRIVGWLCTSGDRPFFWPSDYIFTTPTGIHKCVDSRHG